MAITSTFVRVLQVDASAGPAEWNSALKTARAAGGWLALSVTGAPFTPELQSFVADATKDEVRLLHLYLFNLCCPTAGQRPSNSIYFRLSIILCF